MVMPVAPSGAQAGRLATIRELTQAVSGLSEATRVAILLRVKDALRSAGTCDEPHPEHSADHTGKAGKPCRVESSSNPGRSHHERLDKIERSLAGIRRAFGTINRLMCEACGDLETRGS